MPVYQVTLTYLITVEGEINDEDAVVAATKIVQENPEIYNDAEVEEVERARGLRAEMNVYDDLILPEFDENNPDIECAYQTWKNIVENYKKEEK